MLDCPNARNNGSERRDWEFGFGFYKNGGPLGGEGSELRKERRVVVLMRWTILRPWPLTDTMESTAS